MNDIGPGTEKVHIDSPLADIREVTDYLERVGAHLTGMLRAAITTEGEAGYKRDVATIKFDRDGEVKVTDPELEPDDSEAKNIKEAIKAAVAKNLIPTSIKAGKRSLPDELQGIDPDDVFRFLSPDGKWILFVHQRVHQDDGGKYYVPWTFFSDGIWRMMEPDDGIPLFGLEKLRTATRVMLHEGAKKARAMDDVPEGHPWRADLGQWTHLGWPGGAYSASRVDWSPIRGLRADIPVAVVADNDRPGIEAVRKVSEILAGRSLECVLFDSHFPPGFDLADDWPENPDWWRGKRYIGPSLDDMTQPATWATRKVDTGERGRPSILPRPEFQAEWFVVSKPPVFLHRRRPYIHLGRDEFNKKVRPFSEAEDTGRLMTRSLASQADGLGFHPGQPTGVVTVEGLRVVNTWRPSEIRPEQGDDGPFLDFMAYLVPNKEDRHHLMRWIATLIACPWIRMLYGVLLISETQGVGKGTLGEAILAPLVGPWNTSFPDETTLCDSGFNNWMAHKRLAVVHEIYQGQSKKAYNRLKSVITDKNFEVKRKYMEEYRLDNWIHVYANSNSSTPLRMATKDRRWLVPAVTEEQRPPKYWRGFNSWLEGPGLPTIAHWAVSYVREHGPIMPGEHPPMTSAKREVIDLSRSDGERWAFELAQKVAVEDDPLILRVDEIRKWVADMRGIPVDADKLETPLTLRKSLKAGGLLEPARRVVIDHRPTYLVANFDIPDGATWGDLRHSHKRPEEIWPM